MSDEATTEAAAVQNGSSKHHSNGAGEPAQVPSFRLREESDRRRAAETRAQQLEQQITQLQGEYEKAKTGLGQIQSQHGQDMHLIGLGFQAQSVRRFFRREYSDSVAELQPDQRPTFEDWLTASKDDPLYSVHFERMQPATPAQTEPEPAPQTQGADALLAAVRQALDANPNSGAATPAAHTGRQFSGDEIESIRGKNSGALGGHKDSILATLRAEGLIK
jgi:TolA-binding protein